MCIVQRPYIQQRRHAVSTNVSRWTNQCNREEDDSAYNFRDNLTPLVENFCHFFVFKAFAKTFAKSDDISPNQGEVSWRFAVKVLFTWCCNIPKMRNLVNCV
jgi:hypothetical protein